MIEAVRRIIAYAAALQIEKRQPVEVYSHDRRLASKLRPDFDNDTSAHVTGMEGSAIFFHETNARIDFIVEGNMFHGRDHASGHAFSGAIEDGEVRIRDEDDRAEYRYRV